MQEEEKKEEKEGYDSDPQSPFQINRQKGYVKLFKWKKKEDAFLRRQERKYSLEHKRFSDLDGYISFRTHQIKNMKNSKYKSHSDLDALEEQIKVDAIADIKNQNEDDLLSDDDVPEFLEKQEQKYDRKFKNMDEYHVFHSEKFKKHKKMMKKFKKQQKTKKNGNSSSQSSSSESSSSSNSIHGGRRKTYNKKTNKRNRK